MNAKANTKISGLQDKELQAAARGIRYDIEAVESDDSLRKEKSFGVRAEAVDGLEFRVLDRIDGLLQGPDFGDGDELVRLRRRAEEAIRRLEAVDERLFLRLRERIRAGGLRGAALLAQLRVCAGGHGCGAGGYRREQGEGYDTLDALVNGLLLARPVPLETRAREPEMVYYQKTPAGIVLEMVERGRFTEKDVFFDLGSGLGQAPILVNLISGAAAKGVEIEPAYCGYARECAEGLNLSRVEFEAIDARAADYSRGTVFFMYTPFEGGMLREVLGRLREEARRRTIRVFTYGPCTARVSREEWLGRDPGNGDGAESLGIFTSR